MSIKLLLGQVVIELGLDACLVGHMLKGFLHQPQQPVLFLKRHDEAVMDSEDRCIGPYEVSNDIFADAAVEIHQTQASTATDEMCNIWMALLNGVQQFGKHLIWEGIWISLVVQFRPESLEKGLLVRCIE